MADRIRSTKPELRHLEAFAGLTDAAARVFLLLPTMADDFGRCPAHPTFIAGAVFWARQRSANVIGQLLAELETANLIRRYTAKGGSFLEVVGWSDKGSPTYQYIKRHHPQRYPAPPWNQTSTASTAKTTAETPPDLDQEQEQRSGPGTGPRSLLAELEELLRSLPPGPGGLKPPAGGAAVAAMRGAIDAGELTVDGCRAVMHDVLEKIDAGEMAVNGERHIDNLLASWIRAAADRVAGRKPATVKKQSSTEATKPKKQKLGRKAAQTHGRARDEEAEGASAKQPPRIPELKAGADVPPGRWWAAGGFEFVGAKFIRTVDWSNDGMNEITRRGTMTNGPAPWLRYGLAAWVEADAERAS